MKITQLLTASALSMQAQACVRIWFDETRDANTGKQKVVFKLYDNEYYHQGVYDGNRGDPRSYELDGYSFFAGGADGSWWGHLNYLGGGGSK